MVAVKLKNILSGKYVSNKNEKYTILSILGRIHYIENFNSCLIKRDEIASELSRIFVNAQIEEKVYKHGADPSGRSIVDSINYYLKSGYIVTNYCSNFEENIRINNNWNEGLTVSIKSEEINMWLSSF